MDISVINGVDMTKKANCGNGVFAWLDNGVDSLKRSVFLDKIIIGALNWADTEASNKANMKKKTDSRDSVVAWLSGLVT